MLTKSCTGQKKQVGIVISDKQEEALEVLKYREQQHVIKSEEPMNGCSGQAAHILSDDDHNTDADASITSRQ